MFLPTTSSSAPAIDASTDIGVHLGTPAASVSVNGSVSGSATGSVNGSVTASVDQPARTDVSSAAPSLPSSTAAGTAAGPAAVSGGSLPLAPTSPVPPVSIVELDDGTHLITGSTDGLLLSSVGNDVMTGGGASQTFAFTPGFGHDEVVDFITGGQAHDVIDLSATGFHSLAQVLHHTTMSEGSATIHLGTGDSITLDGVTKGQLRAHPRDIALG